MRMKYHMRDAGAGGAPSSRPTGSPYGVFVDNNLGSQAATTCARCAARCARWRRSGAPPSRIDVTDDPSLVREMALAGCTGVFIGFESLTDENLRAARKRTPRAEDYARRVRSSTTTASR